MKAKKMKLISLRLPEELHAEIKDAVKFLNLKEREVNMLETGEGELMRAILKNYFNESRSKS